MKKNNLLQGAIVALLVASPFASYADSQYPATDFQPKVVYQDESAKSAPAPIKVVAVTTAVLETTVPTVTPVVDDTKYPAADFQPKVLFKDDNYKPSKSAPSIEPISSGTEHKSSASAVVMEQASLKKEESDNNSLFLIIGLVAAGFAATRCPKFAGVFGGSNENTSASNENRETGVTRYLNARIPKVSSVTKYLERTGQPTNVARYIAKQNLAKKVTQDDTDRG